MALAVRGPPRGALADELDSDDRDSGPDVDAKVVTAVLSDTPAASADNDEPMQAGLLPEHHGLAHEQLPLEHPHSMSHGDALPPHLHSHHSLLPHDHPLSHELAAQHIVHEHAHEHRMPHEHESTVVHAVPLHHHHALPPHLHSHGPHHHGHAVTVGLAEEQEDLIRDSASRKRKLSANIEDDKMIGEQRDTDPAGDIPELEPAGGSDGEGAHDEETGSDVSEPHESIDEDEPIPPIRLRKINGKYYVRTNFVAPPSPITEMDRARMQPHSDELWGCVECGKTFRDTQKLKRHLKVHGEKGFVCDIDGCNKRFLDKSKLKRHQLVHTKDRPYPCSFAGCERRFSLAYNRTIHERIHTNVKPFVCDFKGCNAAFAQASNLKSHKRTHEKRRAFYCEYPGCGEEFGKRTNLKTHQKHHGELQIGHFHQHALPHAIPPPHHPHMAHAHPHPHMQQHSQSPHHSQLLPLINPITMLPHNMGPVPMHMGVHIPSVFLPHMVPLPLMGMPMGHMAPPPSAMPMPPSDDPSAVPPPPGLEQQLDDSKQGMYADPDQGTRIHLPDSAAHSDELA